METVDDILLKAVDETLKEIFKETGAKVIYNFLGNNHHLKWEEIAERSEVFSSGIERLLGSGAQVTEKLILKKLHSKLKLEFKEKEGYAFSDYVEELRKKFEGRRV